MGVSGNLGGGTNLGAVRLVCIFAFFSMALQHRVGLADEAAIFAYTFAQLRLASLHLLSMALSLSSAVAPGSAIFGRWHSRSMPNNLDYVQSAASTPLALPFSTLATSAFHPLRTFPNRADEPGNGKPASNVGFRGITGFPPVLEMRFDRVAAPRTILRDAAQRLLRMSGGSDDGEDI